MRGRLLVLQLRDLNPAIAQVLVRQYPNIGVPRKLETILEKVREYFRENGSWDNWRQDYLISIPVTCEDPKELQGAESKALMKFLDEHVKTIPEFRELNLSMNEYNAHVSVDDPKRGSYRFTTMYDTASSEKDPTLYNDFVDLDAAVQNITCAYYDHIDIEKDCFGCIQNIKDELYSTRTTSPCSNCMRRWGEDYFTSVDKPKGKNTTACAGDCPFGKYVCCKECNKIDHCDFVCDDIENYSLDGDPCPNATYWGNLPAAKFGTIYGDIEETNTPEEDPKDEKNYHEISVLDVAFSTINAMIEGIYESYRNAEDQSKPTLDRAMFTVMLMDYLKKHRPSDKTESKDE